MIRWDDRNTPPKDLSNRIIGKCSLSSQWRSLILKPNALGVNQHFRIWSCEHSWEVIDTAWLERIHGNLSPVSKDIVQRKERNMVNFSLRLDPSFYFVSSFSPFELKNCVKTRTTTRWFFSNSTIVIMVSIFISALYGLVIICSWHAQHARLQIEKVSLGTYEEKHSFAEMKIMALLNS